MIFKKPPIANILTVHKAQMSQGEFCYSLSKVQWEVKETSWNSSILLRASCFPSCEMPEESLANSRWQRVNKLRMILGTKNLNGLCKFYSNYIIWLKYKRVCSQGEILKEALTRSLFGSRILWLSVFAWSINLLKWWLVGNLFGRYKRLIGNIVTQNLVGKNYACLLKKCAFGIWRESSSALGLRGIQPADVRINEEYGNLSVGWMEWKMH